MPKFGLEVLTFEVCLFDLNLSIKPVKKFFVYKCKFRSSLSLLYLVDLFINKLKTKLTNLFYRMILELNDFRKNSQLLLKKFTRKS